MVGEDSLATKTAFFEIDHFQKYFSGEKNKMFFTKTQKTTESSVVPKSGLVWCCEFTPRRQKKQTWVMAYLQK